MSFRDARREIAEVLDAHLAQTASLISAQRDGDEREDEDEVDTEDAPALHRYGRRVIFLVWRNGMTLGLHSQHAPDTPLSSVRDGFSDATIGGSRWRVFSTWDARSRVLVQVAEQNHDRSALATAVARNFVVPLAITVPVLGLVILLRNLIDNAIRYSPPSTKVDVEIETADNEGLVRITDAGPGISAKSGRTSGAVSIAHLGRKHQEADSACRSCIGFSSCTEAGCISMRRRQEVDYRSPSRSPRVRDARV